MNMFFGGDSESEDDYDMCPGGACGRGGNSSGCGRGGSSNGCGCGSSCSCSSDGSCNSGSYGGKRKVSYDTTLALPFDPACLEKVILSISDKFDFRVVLSDSRTAGALLVTAGLAVAGSLIGHRCGGKVGAAVGGAVGGACGVGIVALSMRDVWEEIKSKLWDLYDIVYDYLAGLGINDYKTAATFLAKNGTHTSQLGMMLMNVGSDLLGKQILSSLTAS